MGEERELGRLEAKVDMLIASVTELRDDMKQNYMPRSELEPRLQRLENSPQKWVANGIGIAGVIVAIWAVVSQAH